MKSVVPKAYLRRVAQASPDASHAAREYATQAVQVERLPEDVFDFAFQRVADLVPAQIENGCIDISDRRVTGFRPSRLSVIGPSTVVVGSIMMVPNNMACSRLVIIPLSSVVRCTHNADSSRFQKKNYAAMQATHSEEFRGGGGIYLSSFLQKTRDSKAASRLET